MGFLYAVARNIVRDYWRKKYRERRKFCRLYEGDKGEMTADEWKFVTPAPDIKGRMGARARLNTLPERMVKTGIIRAEGGVPLARLQLRLPYGRGRELNQGQKDY